MTIDNKIKDEKLKYDINREAAKISALSSRKVDKYDTLTGGEILPPDRRRVIEQVKFTYSPLGKAFEKQTKQLEALEVLDPGKSQKLNSIERLFSKEMRNDKIKNQIEEIKKSEGKYKQNYWKYETNR